VILWEKQSTRPSTEKEGIGESSMSASLRAMPIGFDQKNDSTRHPRDGALISNIIANSTSRFRRTGSHHAGLERPSVNEPGY
jgi:hypothetical protein